MPFVVNGVGTWYYGKKRVHTIREECEFCHHLTELSSYDTSLFFVIFFIPIIPIKRYRILRNCPVCDKHRYLSLAKWEKSKENDSAELLELLKADPNNRNTIMRAIHFSMAYQDEPLFNSTAQALAEGKTDDAEIQTLLGHGHAYFSHWPEASTAFRAALEVSDTEDIRESLAWALLKQHLPDEARPWLQHILDNKKSDSAGSIYYLVKGYQAQGRHEEALALMDERDEVFPEFVNLKEYKEQRKTSKKYLGSNKKIPSVMLPENRTGYREGDWKSNWPRWVALSILFGLLALYLGSAFWIGQNQKVHFVNGTAKPYMISVAGQDHMLAPRSVKPIRVAEGDVQVAFGNDNPGIEPFHCQIETSFWSRPFTSKTFVINPDQSAIILEEETIYAKNNPPEGKAPNVHFGDTFYDLPSVDYVFEEFPPTLQIKGDTQVTKTRVGHLTNLAPEGRIRIAQKLEKDRQIVVFQKLLKIDPSETAFLHWVTNLMPPKEAVQFLESKLTQRPILVEWHRAYQTTMERTQPEVDLLPRYRQLVTETNSHPDALYLLGRANPDLIESEKQYLLAANGQPPSGFACQGLGFRALSQGKFAEAVQWYEKAMSLPVDKTPLRVYFLDALLANAAYDSYLNFLQQDAVVPGRKLSSQIQLLRVHAIRGDQEKIGQTRAEILRESSPTDRVTLQQALNVVIACGKKSVPDYLTAVGKQPAFETEFLNGSITKAAEFAKDDFASKGVLNGLIWLEAQRVGNQALADTHFKALIEELKQGGRDERQFARILEGQQPLADGVVERMPIEASSKRVLLTVLAKKQPARAKQLLELAKKLDFQHDTISLCLTKFLPKS